MVYEVSNLLNNLYINIDFSTFATLKLKNNYE